MSETDEVQDQIARIFRDEIGSVTAALTRVLGPKNMDLVENVIQDAFMKALKSWRADGVPGDPLGWLIIVARNAALDEVRKDRRHSDKSDELQRWFSGFDQDGRTGDSEVQFSSEVNDNQLRMMFVCCHPSITKESQISLIMRTLCGFEVSDIAKSLLKSDSAIAKQLVRARQTLREEKINFEMPDPSELKQRLDSVLAAIYLLFGEGYSAHHGEATINEELCTDAIRLLDVVLEHPATNLPISRALAALLRLQAARLDSRQDRDGNLLSLRDQDRSRWNTGLIRNGLRFLASASEGIELTNFHLEAAIAACHARSPSFERTDWNQIVDLYDKLISISDNPLGHLNRAIACGFAHGPEHGLAELRKIKNDSRLASYYLLPASFAYFFDEVGKRDEANRYYKAAIQLAPTDQEKKYLLEKISN